MTPLSIDLTRYAMIDAMKDWGLSLDADFAFQNDIEADSPDFQMFRWIDRPIDRPDAAR